ncbi:hypothetical protein BG004_000818 [Podila humilis]|nr:hypothetical protein BG004_000818 [Podila humilis]
MNGAQKRSVGTTPSFLDKGKAIANGSHKIDIGMRNTSNRPSQWRNIDLNPSQESDDDENDNRSPINGQNREEEAEEQALLSEDDIDESFYVPDKSFAQQLSTLDPSLYHGSGDDFCTEENFDQTSAYINHQLSVYGFAANLQFVTADKETASRIRDAEYKEEMNLNWRRLSQDYDSAQQTLSATKALLERSDRENVELQSKLGALEEELSAESEKHKHTREELRSSKAHLQYTKTQFAHEARRKEKETDILKEKIQKSISRGQSSASGPSLIPGGITILNPMPKSLFGKQSVSDTEQLLKEVIEQQKSKETEIVQENQQLRRTLYTVHVEIESLLGKKTPSKSQAVSSYGLPFDMIKEKIETEIQDALTLLSDQWNHRPTQEPRISPTDVGIRDQHIEDLQQQIDRMQNELEDSTLLIQGAQKMIDNLNRGHFLAGMQDFKLNSGGSDLTAQEIGDEETKLKKQREDLAKERKKFTEACLDLGRQREELKKAKLDFEESKRTFHLDKVVSFLSFSPGSAKRTLENSPPMSPSNRQQIHRAKKRMTTTPLAPLGPKLDLFSLTGTKNSVSAPREITVEEDEQEDEAQEAEIQDSRQIDDLRKLQRDSSKPTEVENEEVLEEEEVQMPSRAMAISDRGSSSQQNHQKPTSTSRPPSVPTQPVATVVNSDQNKTNIADAPASRTTSAATSASSNVAVTSSPARPRPSLFSVSSTALATATAPAASPKPSVPFTFTTKTTSPFGSNPASTTSTAATSTAKSISALASKASSSSLRPSTSTPVSSQSSQTTGARKGHTTTIASSSSSSSFSFARPTAASLRNSTDGVGSTSTSASSLAAGTASALRRNQSSSRQAPASTSTTATSRGPPPSKQAQQLYAANQQSFLSSARR